jgi:hypothetical protein
LSELDPEDPFLDSEHGFTIINAIKDASSALGLKKANKKGSKKMINKLKESIKVLSDTSSDFTIISGAEIKRDFIGGS